MVIEMRNVKIELAAYAARGYVRAVLRGNRQPKPGHEKISEEEALEAVLAISEGTASEALYSKSEDPDGLMGQLPVESAARAAEKSMKTARDHGEAVVSELFKEVPLDDVAKTLLGGHYKETVAPYSAAERYGAKGIEGKLSAMGVEAEVSVLMDGFFQMEAPSLGGVFGGNPTGTDLRAVMPTVLVRLKEGAQERR